MSHFLPNLLHLNSLALEKCKILITGPPGVGKTTIIKTVHDKLKQTAKDSKAIIKGFYTAEIRQAGDRVGFKIDGFSTNQEGIIAHTSLIDSKISVGKYRVDVKAFEKVALPEMKDGTIYVIDEIGKMECFSSAFVKRMDELLESEDVAVVASIGQKGEGFIQEAKKKSGVKLIEVSKSNRNTVPENIIKLLTPYL